MSISTEYARPKSNLNYMCERSNNFSWSKCSKKWSNVQKKLNLKFSKIQFTMPSKFSFWIKQKVKLVFNHLHFTLAKSRKKSFANNRVSLVIWSNVQRERSHPEHLIWFSLSDYSNQINQIAKGQKYKTLIKNLKSQKKPILAKHLT